MRPLFPERPLAERIAHEIRALAPALVAAILLAPITAGGLQNSDPLPSCEWCGAAEAPDSLSWQLTIAGPDEPGDRMILTGAVYDAAGKSPAAGVLIYAYHTNAGGVYPKRGDEIGNGRRHGYLRGWLRTDEDGMYRIETIRPGSYPSGSVPAHVHMTVTPPGGEEDWIDSIHFEDDPLLTDGERERLSNRGGSGVVSLERDEDGVWRGRRDIYLLN